MSLHIKLNFHQLQTDQPTEMLTTREPWQGCRRQKLKQSPMAHLVEFFFQNAIFRWWRLVLRDPSETIFRGNKLNWSGLHSTTFFLQNRELRFPNSSPSLSSSHVRCPVSHHCQQCIPTLYRRRLMHTLHQNHRCHRKVRSENESRTERKNGEVKELRPKKKVWERQGQNERHLKVWISDPWPQPADSSTGSEMSFYESKLNINHDLSQLNLQYLLIQLFLTSSS